MRKGRSTIAMALAGAMLLASCSLVIVNQRKQEHRRPGRADYAAPLVESVVAVAAAVATIFVARSEAGDPDCIYGELGSSCGHRYTGAFALGWLAVIEAGFSTYGWWKIHDLRHPPIVDGCPDPSVAIEQVAGCPAPTLQLIDEAIATARVGDCVTTKAIAAELRARGQGTIRDARILNDVAIQGCLAEP